MFTFKQMPLGITTNHFLGFEGILAYVEKHGLLADNTKKEKSEEAFYKKVTCPECKGKRLKKESLHFCLDNKNISETSALSIQELFDWIDELPQKLGKQQNLIASEILKEIKTRVGFLLDVGLH